MFVKKCSVKREKRTDEQWKKRTKFFFSFMLCAQRNQMNDIRNNWSSFLSPSVCMKCSILREDQFEFQPSRTPRLIEERERERERGRENEREKHSSLFFSLHHPSRISISTTVNHQTSRKRKMKKLKKAIKSNVFRN